MGGTFKATRISHQHLASPDVAIQTQAGTIPDDANGRSFDAIFSQHRSQVRVMMLHPYHRQARCQRQACGGIVRMHVAGDPLRLNVKERLVERHGGLVMLQRLGIFHVANMLANKGVLIAR